MRFEDEEVKKLDCTNVNDVVILIVEYLCGEKYYKQLSEDDKRLIENLMTKTNKEGLNYEQFNELLLLLNQDKVERDFFKFFFEKDKIFLDDLKEGIVKFRGFAMLCFGNFRFAYKQLIDKSKSELEEKIKPYLEDKSERIKKFKARPTKMLEIEKIERPDETWYTGELTGGMIKKNIDLLKLWTPPKGEEINFLEFGKQLKKMAESFESANRKALQNTDIYLTWDYIDVYIATSMRHKWEFEETFDFVEKVFGQSFLKGLNLRYFDPTQSKCSNPRDKGIIEGLMLKRASCTIYMAQESDTMGKDSELAATLAQSTPVIAYVPTIKPQEYSKKIKEYPLDFFKKRLLILDAQGVFNEPDCIKKLQKCDKKFKMIIDDFLKKLNKYRKSQPFSLWFERDNKEFKETYADFDKICKILAIAESYNFDSRAELLKGRHPLSMQVDLQTGIANGVLVVRKAKQCAKLLHKLLINSAVFKIKHPKFFNLFPETVKALCNLNRIFKEKFYYDSQEKTLNLVKGLTDKEIDKLEKLSENPQCPDSMRKPLKRFLLEGATILEEKVSKSPFRVVTDNEKLTNSFWNFFT